MKLLLKLKAPFSIVYCNNQVVYVVPKKNFDPKLFKGRKVCHTEKDAIDLANDNTLGF